MKLEMTRSIVITLTAEEAAHLADILNTSDQAAIRDQCSEEAAILRGELFDALAEKFLD